jgi:hypothetical protein
MCPPINNLLNNFKIFKECFAITLMTDSQVKQIHIEGDKSFFVSKKAVDRFKKDLRNKDTEKLQENDYFVEDWTYELVSENETEMRIKIVNKVKGPRVLPCDEKRKLLKSKIFKMTNDRTSHDNIKNKSIVPKGLLNEYLALKKHKLPMELHDPAKVLSKPEEYRNIIHTMVKSFGMYKGNNNPVINYYCSLEKHLEEKIKELGATNKTNLSTTATNLNTNSIQKNALISQLKNDILGPPPPVPDDTLGVTKDFIQKLQLDRDSIPAEEIDEDMKKIYESMGISINN